MIRLMTDPHSTTFRAALYARVSTEDRQAPEDSIAWQRSVAATLIQASGGRIVVEYLDVGVSRSLPWSRRPEAARLLSDCSRRDRGFDAVVIGEPQRAFSGAQFALTFPLFVHHGVELWVPEVGGRVDPDSEAHDLVMSLFGGLSKAERARIQRRVRNAMQTMARAGGRYLGGRPPYGYRLVPMREHPNAEKARLGATLNRLEPDPATAPIVAAHLQRAARREELQRHRADAQRERNPLAVSRRSSPQFASRSATVGQRVRCARSSPTLATPATRSGTVNVVTMTSSTRPRRPTATYGACAGTDVTAGSGRPSPPTRRSSTPTNGSESKPLSHVSHAQRLDTRRDISCADGCTAQSAADA